MVGLVTTVRSKTDETPEITFEKRSATSGAPYAPVFIRATGLSGISVPQNSLGEPTYQLAGDWWVTCNELQSETYAKTSSNLPESDWNNKGNILGWWLQYPLGPGTWTGQIKFRNSQGSASVNWSHTVADGNTIFGADNTLIVSAGGVFNDAEITVAASNQYTSLSDAVEAARLANNAGILTRILLRAEAGVTYDFGSHPAAWSRFYLYGFNGVAEVDVPAEIEARANSVIGADDEHGFEFVWHGVNANGPWDVEQESGDRRPFMSFHHDFAGDRGGVFVAFSNSNIDKFGLPISTTQDNSLASERPEGVHICSDDCELSDYGNYVMFMANSRHSWISFTGCNIYRRAGASIGGDRSNGNAHELRNTNGRGILMDGCRHVTTAGWTLGGGSNPLPVMQPTYRMSEGSVLGQLTEFIFSKCVLERALLSLALSENEAHPVAASVRNCVLITHPKNGQAIGVTRGNVRVSRSVIVQSLNHDGSFNPITVDRSSIIDDLRVKNSRVFADNNTIILRQAGETVERSVVVDGDGLDNVFERNNLLVAVDTSENNAGGVTLNALTAFDTPHNTEDYWIYRAFALTPNVNVAPGATVKFDYPVGGDYNEDAYALSMFTGGTRHKLKSTTNFLTREEQFMNVTVNPVSDGVELTNNEDFDLGTETTRVVYLHCPNDRLVISDRALDNDDFVLLQPAEDISLESFVATSWTNWTGSENTNGISTKGALDVPA